MRSAVSPSLHLTNLLSKHLRCHLRCLAAVRVVIKPREGTARQQNPRFWSPGGSFPFLERLFSVSLDSEAFGPPRLPQTFRQSGLFYGAHCCVTDVPPWSLTLLASSATLAMLPVETRGQRTQGCLQAIFPSQPAWLLPDTSATVTFPQRGTPFPSGPHLSSIRAGGPRHLRPPCP